MNTEKNKCGSVRFAFPFFCLLVFLLASAFYAKPGLVLGRSGKKTHTRPVIPVIALITSDHWTTVISFITSWTNPDLITPFIPNHISTDSLGDDAAATSLSLVGWSLDGGRWRWRWRQHGWRTRWRGCRRRGRWRKNWRRTYSGSGTHSGHWGPRWRRSGLCFWHHFTDHNLVLSGAHSEGQSGYDRRRWDSRRNFSH